MIVIIIAINWLNNEFMRARYHSFSNLLNFGGYLFSKFIYDFLNFDEKAIFLVILY